MRPNTAKIVNNKAIEFDDQDAYTLLQSRNKKKIGNNISPQSRVLTAFRAHRKHLFQGDMNQQIDQGISPARSSSKTLSKAPSLRSSQLREENQMLQDSIKFQFSQSLKNMRALQQVSKKWVPKNQLDGFDYFGSSIINYQTGLKFQQEPYQSPGTNAFTTAISKMRQQRIKQISDKEVEIEKKPKPFHEAYIEKIIQKHADSKLMQSRTDLSKTDKRFKSKQTPDKVRPYKMLYVQGHSYTQNNQSQPNMLSSSLLTQNNKEEVIQNNYQYLEPFKNASRQSEIKEKKQRLESPHHLFKNPLIKDTFSRLSSLNEFNEKPENFQSLIE